MRSGTFKLMSVITFACLLFPLFELLGVFVGTGKLGYLTLVAGIAVACISLLIAGIINTDSKGLAIGTVIVLSGIASATMVFGLQFSIRNTFIVFVYSFFVGYVGFRAYSRDLTETLSKKKIISLILIMIGALIVSAAKFPSMTNEMLTAFVIALVTSMFILNRSLLEGLYKRKSSDGTDVSKMVQRYNLFIVGGFAAVFIGLFLIKNFVAFLLSYGAAKAGLGMLNIFKVANEGSFSYDDNTVTDITPKIPVGLQIQAASWAEKSFQIMFGIVIVILSIVLIVIIVKLIKYAPAKIQLFIQKLKDFFSKMMGLSQVGVKVRTADFVDEVENIDKDDLGDDKRFKMLQNQRKVRTIKDPVERMRAFYGYFMNTLKKNNVPLFVSDTSYQIYDKSHLVCDMEDITKKVTDIYNQVRYNDIVPDDKMLESVDEYMSVITKNCKAIKTDDVKKKKK